MKRIRKKQKRNRCYVMMMMISISGNLYFTNVEAKDRTDGDGYVCIVNNENLRLLSTSDDEKVYPVTSPGTN